MVASEIGDGVGKPERRYLETSSQSGPLRVASRKAESMSERICSRASVSWRGHRFPVAPLPPLSPPSPSSSGKLPPAAPGASSSKFAAGGRLLKGDGASASGGSWSGSGPGIPSRCAREAGGSGENGVISQGGTPYLDPPCCCMPLDLLSSLLSTFLNTLEQ